jgi:HK97 family phage portal protein
MGFFDLFRREERSVTASDSQAWARFFKGWDLPSSSGAATPALALTATPVFAAVDFLSSAMATMSRHVMRKDGEGSTRVTGGIANILDGNINDEWSSFRWVKYSFWQTFTGGRSFTWIERPNGQILNLWPLDPCNVEVKRVDGRTVYEYTENGRKITYPASDIIDVPFALESDQLCHISPLDKGKTAIGLLLAMEKYASGFFAGGGVPPLALEGPMPTGGDGMRRMMADVNRAIDGAKQEKKPVFPMPPGYTLKSVGFEPEKGQMTEARRFQVEEIARLYNLPPWFLQDLTHANFANSENQDLHLVKHTLAHWVRAFEQELNLKLFGRRNTSRWVVINMDSLLRGDFKTRSEGIARLIQVGAMKPKDGTKYVGGLDDNTDPAADKFYMQGAMVPLGAEPKPTQNSGTPPPANGGTNDDGA